MHKPRILFFDIDGTLIDMEKKRITERTLDALRRLQQNGILLAVAGCADADSKRRSAWSSGVGCRTDAAALQRDG